MPKKTPNYIVLMKYVNKLMHELFLRHTKSRNTIVKRWEWCWLQSWQGQVAFWSAWLGIFYNIMLPSTSKSHTLAIQSGQSSAPENQRRSRLNSQSVAGSCLLMASTDIIDYAKPCTSKCNLTLPTLKPAPLPSLNNTRSTLWHIEPWWTLLYLQSVHSQMQPTHSFN